VILEAKVALESWVAMMEAVERRHGAKDCFYCWVNRQIVSVVKWAAGKRGWQDAAVPDDRPHRGAG
jgi:hypothetical protein